MEGRLGLLGCRAMRFGLEGRRPPVAAIAVLTQHDAKFWSLDSLQSFRRSFKEETSIGLHQGKTFDLRHTQ